MAHLFNRVGNAPRFKFQISNTKSQIEQSLSAGHAVKRADANRVQHNTNSMPTQPLGDG